MVPGVGFIFAFVKTSVKCNRATIVQIITDQD